MNLLNHIDLELLIAEGEGYLVEFKSGFSKGFAKEMVAFANASGGRILVGIEDSGELKPIVDQNRLRSQIQDCANNCDPSVVIELQFLKNIIVVHVFEGIDKPYQCAEGFFLRMGANSQKMGRQQLIDFIETEGRIRFEEQIHRRFVFEKHYDPLKLQRFLKLAQISSDHQDAVVLENLGVAERGDSDELLMRNVGVLLFSKNINLLCEQAIVTCGTFEGTERFQIVNRKDYAEDVITNIEMAMHYIRQELRVRYEMKGNPQREEVYEIPLDAIREALVNAVVHRDYMKNGSHVVVEFFDDRLEISSPGGLPKGMNKKDLGRRAVRRNQILASLLQRAELVENMGTGIEKIRRLLAESGGHEPIFEIGDFFTVIFSRQTAQETAQETAQDNTKVKILELFRKNPKYTKSDIMEILGKADGTIKEHISKLKKEGKLVRVGSTKSGHWDVQD